jgi:uncharacterized membrane protein
MKDLNLVKIIHTLLFFIGVIACGSIFIPQTRQMLSSLFATVINRGKHVEQMSYDLLPAAIFFLVILVVFALIFIIKIKLPPFGFKKEKIKLYNSVFIALLIIYAVSIIYLGSINSSLWTDEVFTIRMINHSWQELMPTIMNFDAHPPLHYLYLKLSTEIFGDSIFAMRLSSIFLVIIMVFCVSLFLKKEFSYRSAFIFILLCIASSSITFCALKIRMYVMAMFFVTLTPICAYYFFTTDKKIWWVALIMCFVGAAGTHYYAAVVAVIWYLFILFYSIYYKKGRLIQLLLIALVSFIVFLPWLPVFYKQFIGVSGNFWIGPISIFSIISFFTEFFNTNNHFVNIFLFFLYSIVFILFFKKKKKNYFILTSLLTALLLVVLGIVFSILIRPLFIARYILPVCVLIWYAFAVACREIRSDRVMAFVYTSVISIAIMSFTLTAKNEITQNTRSIQFLTFMNERLQPDDIFVFYVVENEGFMMSNYMRHLFPNNLYMNPRKERFLEHWDNLIVLDLEVYNEKRVWTFAQYDKNHTPKENFGEFCGIFQYYDVQFELYLSIPR